MEGPAAAGPSQFATPALLPPFLTGSFVLQLREQGGQHR